MMKVPVFGMIAGSCVLYGIAAALAGPNAPESGLSPASFILGKPAQLNPYNGMQEPERVYEFAEKPTVKCQGSGDNKKLIVSFASKAACDATVAILNKEGQVIRHLASGVLGKNAPYPFQQNALAQKLEWDGLTDNFQKADVTSCVARVSLGLKPEFERNILWDPNELFTFPASADKGRPKPGEKGDLLIQARDKDGSIYAIDHVFDSSAQANGRVFDKDGKYLRTFYPPPASEMPKLMAQQGYKLVTTIWGDKTAIGNKMGFLTGSRSDTRTKPMLEKSLDAMAALKAQPGVGEVSIAPRPKEIPASALDRVKTSRDEYSVALAFLGKFCRMAADRMREELYFGYIKTGIFRVDGKTGALDKAWFPNGELGAVVECSFGPDGLLYFRTGPMGYGRWLMRLDHEGKPVPFGGDAIDFPRNWPDDKHMFGVWAGKTPYGGPNYLPAGFSRKEDTKVLWTGVFDHINTHDRGLYVSPGGMIVCPNLCDGAPKAGKDGPAEWPAYLLEKGIPAIERSPFGASAFVAVMDVDGNYHTANAVGDTVQAHGSFMDRDGNIYAMLGGTWNRDDKLDGLADSTFADWKDGHCSLAKFRWNGKFPLSALDYSVLKTRNDSRKIKDRPEILWRYDGVSGYTFDCSCHNNRSDMDYWGRSFLTANHLCSVMVLDSNGNRVARIGRYGNVDDADSECGGVHFGWVRCVAVSDTAVYVDDQPNRRIAKVALKYGAEETAAIE